MIRHLAIWPELAAFLATWPQWHRQRRAPKPTRTQLTAQWIAARRQHRGAREAWLRLRDATHEALRQEINRERRA